MPAKEASLFVGMNVCMYEYTDNAYVGIYF